MKRYFLQIIIFIFPVTCMFAQSMDGLKSINTKSKIQYVKPEDLDQLMIDLRPYENSQVSGQDSLLLDTYNSISSGYSVNNHFKQAYEIFLKYLSKKEEMLTRDKTATINNVFNSVSGKQGSDEKEQTDLQNTLDQLKNDNTGLESRRLSFKRNFSFALIVLSSIFALMIVSSGIRMLSLRSKLRQSRDRMKNIHRYSVIGNLEKGYRTSFQSSLSSIEDQTKELQQALKKQDQNYLPVKQVNQVLAGIEKRLKEVRNGIR